MKRTEQEKEAYKIMLRHSEYLREDAAHRPFWLTWKWATGIVVVMFFIFVIVQGGR